MFRLISRPDPAPMEFPVGAANLVYGQCVQFSNGALVAATSYNSPVAGVTIHAADANSTCKIILVDPEQIWEADVVGSAHATFKLGLAGAHLDSTAGTTINAAANATSNLGPCSIIKLDTTNKKCWVKFKTRQLT
jgi:hypothetical protein